MMGDYTKSAVGFGNAFLSLWIAVWMETEDDNERKGKLLCTWFTVFFSQYGVLKFVGKAELDCTHYEATYYWYTLLLRTLWQKAYWSHDHNQKRKWLITFVLSICSIITNYLISQEYDRYDTETLWSNSERVRDPKPFFEYFSYVFLLTYCLLLSQFNKVIFVFWIIMHCDILLDILRTDVQLRKNLFGEITRIRSGIVQSL